jgi:ankyrin repeat protein
MPKRRGGFARSLGIIKPKRQKKTTARTDTTLLILSEAKERHFKSVMSILQANGDDSARLKLLNTVDAEGNTVLMYAAKYSSLETINTLMDCGAQITPVNNGDETVLSFAAENKEHPDLLQVLFAKFRTQAKSTTENAEVEKYLVAAEHSLNKIMRGDNIARLNIAQQIINSFPLSPISVLMWFAADGLVEEARELFAMCSKAQQKEMLEEQDINNKIVLELAVLNGHKNMIAFLLEQMDKEWIKENLLYFAGEYSKGDSDVHLYENAITWILTQRPKVVEENIFVDYVEEQAPNAGMATKLENRELLLAHPVIHEKYSAQVYNLLWALGKESIDVLQHALESRPVVQEEVSEALAHALSTHKSKERTLLLMGACHQAIVPTLEKLLQDNRVAKVSDLMGYAAEVRIAGANGDAPLTNVIADQYGNLFKATAVADKRKASTLLAHAINHDMPAATITSMMAYSPAVVAEVLSYYAEENDIASGNLGKLLEYANEVNLLQSIAEDYTKILAEAIENERKQVEQTLLMYPDGFNLSVARQIGSLITEHMLSALSEEKIKVAIRCLLTGYDSSSQDTLNTMIKIRANTVCDVLIEYITKQDKNSRDYEIIDLILHGTLYGTAQNEAMDLLEFVRGNSAINLANALVRNHQDIDVNRRSVNGVTVLMRGSAHNQKTFVLILLTQHRKLKINLQNSDGHNALMLAARNGCTTIVGTLLTHKRININAQDNQHKTALILAIEQGGKTIDTVRVLVEAFGTDINLTDEDGSSPIMYAVEKGNVDAVRMLCGDSTLEVNHQNRLNNSSALHWAAIDGNYHVVSELLQRADLKVDLLDSINYTPLRRAEDNGHWEIIPRLLCHPTMPTDVVRTKISEWAQDYYILSQETISSQLVGPSEDILSKAEFMRRITEYHVEETKHVWLIAATQGDIATIIGLLRSATLDFNAFGEEYLNALVLAASHGHHHIMEELLNDHRVIEVDDEVKKQILSTALCYLIANAKRGDGIEVIKLLIQRGADVNCFLGEACPPLLLAVAKRDIDSALLLIEKGATVDLSAEGITPLGLSIMNKDESMMQALLASGANPELASGGLAPLSLAVLRANSDLVSTLIDAGADASTIEANHISPLYFAIHNRDVAMVSSLIEGGADVYAPVSENNFTALDFGIHCGDEGVVCAIVTRITDVNRLIMWETTSLLLWAIGKKDAAMVSLLIEKGADVNLVVREAPLVAAACMGNAEIMYMLVQAGADVNLAPNSNTALEVIIIKDSIENVDDMALALIPGITDIDKILSGERTLLHWSVQCNKIKIASTLIEIGADVNLTNPLRTAVLDENIAMVALLINGNAEVNLGSPSPLLIAIYHDYTEIASMLLEAGAYCNNSTIFTFAFRQENNHLLFTLLKAIVKEDDNICDARSNEFLFMKTGEEMLQGFRNWFPFFLIKFLYQARSRTERYDVLIHVGGSYAVLTITQLVLQKITGMAESMFPLREYLHKNSSILIKAVVEDNVKVIDLLLRWGAYPNIRDENNNTALTIASSMGYDASTKALLGDIKIDINAQNDNGQSALMCALLNRHEKVARLLLASSNCKISSLKDRNNETALHYAIVYKSELAIEIGSRVIKELGSIEAARRHYGHHFFDDTGNLRVDDILPVPEEARPASSLPISIQGRASPPLLAAAAIPIGMPQLRPEVDLDDIKVPEFTPSPSSRSRAS